MNDTLVVDVMNVVGSRPDGWWKDRHGAIRRLVHRLCSLDEHRIVAVIDGRFFEVLANDAPQHVEVVFAPGGRNAADDRIIFLLRELDDVSEVRVVTSDAELQRRVRELGGAIISAGAFIRKLEAEG